MPNTVPHVQGYTRSRDRARVVYAILTDAPMILLDVETGTRMEEGSATPASTRSMMLRAM